MSKAVNLTEGKPMPTIFVFAVPMILSNLFQQLYNVIDTLIVGKALGLDPLAALGCASSVIFVFIQLSTGFSLGASVVISQYFGAGKKDRIRSAMTTSAIFCVFLAIVSMVGIWIWARPVLAWANTPEGAILDYSVQYLRFYFLGAIPIFVYNSLNGVYVALGNSRTPLVFLIVSSLVNIGLDLLFITVFGWGVEGAAAATAISQLVACILAIIDIPKFIKEFGRSEDSKVFDTKILAVMLKIALPTALQQSIVSVGSFIVQRTINSFGPEVIAASAAAAKVVNLASAVSINYSNAYSNYVGQNMGAGKTDRVKPGLYASITVCGIISIFMTIIFEIFANPIINAFIDKTEDIADIDEVLSVGAEYIRVVGAFLPVFCVFMITKATFKGAGDMGWFISVTLLSFFIRLFITLGFANKAGVGVIWWAICLGWVISLAVTLFRFYQGGWRNKKIN